MTAEVTIRVRESIIDPWGMPVGNTMKAKALHTALSDAVLFAAPTTARMPFLEAVRLEFGGGQLVAVATDRFVLGASKVEYSGEAFMMMVAGADAKALVKMAKTAKRDEKTREVTIEVVDAGAQVTFRFSTGESLVVRGVDVQFPKWRQLLPADTSRMGGIVGMGYVPAYMGRFTKARAEEQATGAMMVVFPSVTSSGKPGPTAIRIAVEFTKSRAEPPFDDDAELAAAVGRLPRRAFGCGLDVRGSFIVRLAALNGYLGRLHDDELVHRTGPAGHLRPPRSSRRHRRRVPILLDHPRRRVPVKTTHRCYP